MRERLPKTPQMELSSLIERWHKSGFKPTPQRVLIYEILAQTRSHPSAEEIFLEARRRYPALSLNTVYKTLDALVAKGEVATVDSNMTRTRYEIALRPHHHFHCRGCGSIVDVEMPKLKRMPLPSRYRGKFELGGYRINFFGLCQHCSANSKKK